MNRPCIHRESSFPISTTLPAFGESLYRMTNARESETREHGKREDTGNGKTRETGSKVLGSGVFTTLACVR